MRLVHTADWHLGLDFYEFARLPEQICFLNWLADTLVRLNAEVLLVAGDIFNTSAPSTAVQRAYFDFLTQVTRRLPELQIVMIAGNHDSGTRLEAPSALLENLNIHIKGSVVHNPTDYSIDYGQFAIPLRDRSGKEYICLAIPFLRANDCPPKKDEAENYTEAFYRELTAYFATDPRPKICMGHLYAAGVTLEEERDIEYAPVGGLEGVSLVKYLKPYSYIALGHIHRQQRVYNAENVRYAGAPIATTFTHRQQEQGVVVVDIDDAATKISFEAFASPLKLLKYSGKPDEILMQLSDLSVGVVDDFAPIIAIEVVDQARPPLSFKQEVDELLKGRYARRGPFTFKAAVTDVNRDECTAPLSVLDHRYEPEEIAEREYRKYHNGESLPAPLKRLLQEAIQEAKQCES